MSFQTISLKNIEESKTNPRKRFDDKALAELAESIKGKGVLQPVLVRLLSKNGTDKYELVAGARRFRAASIAGLEDIPCIVKEWTDEQALEVQVIENLQREDVHPLEEALGYKALLDTGHYEVEGIAAKVGKSLSYIYSRQKLLALSPEAQKEFLAGEITAGHAILLARVQDHYQELALTVMLWETTSWGANAKRGKTRKPNATSVRELSRWLKEYISNPLKTAPFDTKSATLLKQAGACHECPKRTGADKLGLFDDEDDGKDECLDPGCWQKKVQAHYKELLKAATAKHGLPAVFITGRYSSSIPGIKVYGSYEWQKADQAKAGYVGLVTDEKFRPVFILLGSQRQASSSPRDPAADRRRRALEVRKRKVQKEWRQTLQDRIEEHWPKKNDIELLRAIVSKEITKGYNSQKEAIKKKLGWTGKDEANINKADEATLIRALFLVETEDEVYEPSYGYNGLPTDLIRLCELHKIDHAAIKKEIEAKHPVPAKPSDKKKMPPKPKAAKVVKSRRGRPKPVAKKSQTSAKTKKSVKGICRVCKCTETTPCTDEHGGTCAWTDKTQTLCTACEGKQ